MDLRPGAQGDAQDRKFYRRLTDELCEAVRIDVRYNTHDHNGLTRLERNYEAANRKLPEYDEFDVVTIEEGDVFHLRAVPPIPDKGQDLWRMFWGLSRHRVERNPISPEAVAAWLRMHGQRLSTLEAGVIEAMDRKFLETLSDEIEANQARANPRRNG